MEVGRLLGKFIKLLGRGGIGLSLIGFDGPILKLA